MLGSYDSQAMRRLLIKRFAYAIGIIGCITLLSVVAVFAQLREIERDARLINISGRQRMLSQRLTKTALALEAAADSSERERRLKELRETLELWQQSHEGLLNGDAALGLPGANSRIWLLSSSPASR